MRRCPRLELGERGVPDTPDLADRDPDQPQGTLRLAGEVAHAPEFRHALGDVVSELGQRLCRPDPDAG